MTDISQTSPYGHEVVDGDLTPVELTLEEFQSFARRGKWTEKTIRLLGVPSKPVRIGSYLVTVITKEKA